MHFPLFSGKVAHGPASASSPFSTQCKCNTVLDQVMPNLITSCMFCLKVPETMNDDGMIAKCKLRQRRFQRVVIPKSQVSQSQLPLLSSIA